MKCSDVLKALSDDAGDLEAVRRHLEGCPECSREFARDLEFEEALRSLDLGLAPADITLEVKEALDLLSRQRSRQDLIRKWTWAIVSVAVFVLLAIAMPFLAGWLNAAYDLMKGLDMPRSLDSAASPAVTYLRSVHLFYFMVAILAWVVAYVWREVKRAPQ